MKAILKATEHRKNQRGEAYQDDSGVWYFVPNEYLSAFRYSLSDLRVTRSEIVLIGGTL